MVTQTCHHAKNLGVGSRLSQRLAQLDIVTGWDLACAPAKLIRKHFGVTLERVHAELNGEACLLIDELPQQKADILHALPWP